MTSWRRGSQPARSRLGSLDVAQLHRAILRGFASLAFPPACPACGDPVQDAPLPCPSCDTELRGLWESMTTCGPGSEDLMSALPVEGACRELVHRMKYQGNQAAAALLAQLMTARLEEWLPHAPGAVLIPVPLHPVRLRERGFNQAERLARRIARRVGLEVRTDILIRTRFTKSLTTLAAEERRLAVAGAFKLRRPPPVSRPLVLVDDVWTTGATASACIDLLLRKEAPRPVRVLTAARTPAPSD